MKKIILVIIIAVSILLLTACGGYDIQATQENVDYDAEVLEEENVVRAFHEWLNGDMFSLRYTIIFDNMFQNTTESTGSLAVSGNNIAMSFSSGDEVGPFSNDMRTIIRDGVVYLIDDMDMTITQLPYTEDDFSSSSIFMMADYNEIRHVRSGVGEVHGRTLPFEEYTYIQNDRTGMMRYFIYNNEVYAFAYTFDFDDYVFFTVIFTYMSDNVEEYIFELPTSYTEIEFAFEDIWNDSGNVDGFEFVIDDGIGIIVGFTGEQYGDLIIPDRINGFIVMEIGERAFYGMSGFTGELVIPETVIYIGDYAFAGCYGFTGELILPRQLITLGEGAFAGCSGFTGELVIPDFTTLLRESTFSGCSGITYLDLNNVSIIQANAFAGWEGLTSLIIPSSVVSIGAGAFRDNINLSRVEFMGTLGVFNNTAFENSPDNMVVINGPAGLMR